MPMSRSSVHDRHRRTRRMIAALLFCAACSGAPDTRVEIDLTSEIAAWRVWAQTTHIDFGGDGDERFLLEGWGPPESLADGTSVRWGVGPRSLLQFYAPTSTRLRISGRCWPHVYPGAPAQAVSVRVNDEEVATFEVTANAPACEFSVPGRNVRRGLNLVEFHYRYSGSPLTPKDDVNKMRPLSVLWDSLQFEPVLPTNRPYTPPSGKAPKAAMGADGRRRLTLPARSRVDYYLDLVPGTEFSAAGIDRHDTSTRSVPILEIEDADGNLAVVPLGDTPHPIRTPLPLGRSGIVRLSISAPASLDARGRFEIIAPALLIPATAQAELPRKRTKPRTPEVDRPNIVLFLVDTLRADHLGAYGYPKPTSPNIDAFAREAVLFRDAHAETSWTRPTVASLLTGLSIRSHGVLNLSKGIPDSARTIAESLRDRGYRTAGFTANAQVSGSFGFARGFEEYQLLDRSALHEQVLDWIDGVADGRPFFLFAHYIDPHAPYDPDDVGYIAHAPDVDKAIGESAAVDAFNTEMIRLRREKSFRAAIDSVGVAPATPIPVDQLRALYDAEIFTLDERFGEFLSSLRKRRLFDDSLIIFVADHGEEFADHGGLSHGQTLYQEQLHVPLIVRFPKGRFAGTAMTSVVRQIDVAPTILDLAGAIGESGHEGSSLVELIEQADPDRRSPPAIAMLRWLNRDLISVRLGSMKWIHNMTRDRLRPTFELYDISVDPAERENLYLRRSVVAGYLRSQLDHTEPDAPRHQPSSVTLSEETKERLRALGYAQ